MVALVCYDVSMYQKTMWRLLLEHVACELRLGYYTNDAVCVTAKNGTRNSKLMVALSHGITKGYLTLLFREENKIHDDVNAWKRIQVENLEWEHIQGKHYSLESITPILDSRFPFVKVELTPKHEFGKQCFQIPIAYRR
ncbi:hypothetical protein AKJ16_DCAP27055 [Drosera capensis]